MSKLKKKLIGDANDNVYSCSHFVV